MPITNREFDWVTAPGEYYTKFHCPPPPCSSDSLYLSSLWIGTSGTVTVEELAPAGDDPDSIPPEEQARFRKWAFQQVALGLGEALMEAEDELSTPSVPVKLEPADITLSAKALRIMSATFKIRADAATPPVPPTSSSGHSMS